MRRFAGAVLTGLGGLLLAVAVGLPLFVTPTVAKLPYDQQPCPKPPAVAPAGCLHPSVADAANAQILQINDKGLNIITGDLRTTTEVIPEIKLTADQQDAGKLDGNAVIWSAYQTVAVKNTGEPVNNSSTQLALDRTTGEAVDWDGQWIEDKVNHIKYTGLTYKFPFGTEKRDYQIYDTTVRAASTAKFQAVEDVGGLSTYHFIQQIPDTKVTVSPNDMAVLIKQFAPKATSGTVTYRNTREVWVDPVTGAFMKIRERQHQQLKASDGTTQVLLDADFNSTPESIANSVASAKDSGSQLKFISVYVPVGAGLLGLLLVIVGVLLLRQPAPAVQAGGWDENLSESRHRPRG